MVNARVCVQVDSANDCKVIEFGCFLLLGVEETFKVLLVDVLEVAVVNSGVSCIPGKSLLTSLELLLQILSITMHFYLSQDELGEVFLNVQCEVVVRTANAVGSLSRLGTELAVRTGKDHLHKVWVVQSTVLIGVKELDQIVAVSLRHTSCNSIVA